MLVALVLARAVAACGPRAATPAVPPRPAPPPCPSALVAMLPRNAESWVFARPRAIYDHPRLGRVVGHAFDDAGERALVRRAERWGYDVRTIERATVAWTPRGAVYAAAGPLDHARVAALLWERLLPPQRRGTDAHGNVRMEGALANDTVALLVSPRCAVAAYAEGQTRSVNRVLTGNDARDPDALVVFHTRQLPAAVTRLDPDAGSGGGGALARFVREMEVRVTAEADGVRVVLALSGPALPADTEERIRRALAAVVASPIGDLAGAVQWATPDRVAFRRAGDTVEASLLAPWRGLAALADGMRGEVGRERVE